MNRFLNWLLNRFLSWLSNKCLQTFLDTLLDRYKNTWKRYLRNRLSDKLNRLINWHLLSNWNKLLSKSMVPNSIHPRVRSTNQRLSHNRLTQTKMRYLTISSRKRFSSNCRVISNNRLSSKWRIRWVPCRKVINTSWGYLRITEGYWIPCENIGLMSKMLQAWMSCSE